MAATVLLAALLGRIWWLPEVVPPTYEVAVSGLQEHRDLASEPEPLSARGYGETPITLVATALAAATDRDRLGLYRLEENSLERIPEGDELRRESRSGVVIFRAPAAFLADDKPGASRLFLVTTQDRDLPQTLPLESVPSTTPGSVVVRGMRVQSWVLHLHPTPPPGSGAGETVPREDTREPNETLDLRIDRSADDPRAPSGQG